MSKSFEDATAFARETSDCEFGEHPSDLVREWCEIHDCGTCTVCLNRVLDRLQKAHEHEMEQLRRSRFREGYEAGQRSMDAEHYQLKLRLQGLKFGDGSHENLSRLAYAIYPCPTGWGKESCEGLRDKLIELLGGVHDGSSAPSPTACGACDDACARDNGDETEMSDNGTRPNADRTCPNAVQEPSITDELREWYRATPYLGKGSFELCAIADRIDEQFNHAMTSRSAELGCYKLRINQLEHERDKLVDNRDMWRGKAMQLTDVVDRYVGRCEDLLDLLRDAAVDFKNASYGWDYALIVSENITIETERNSLLKERDELRKSLREIAERAGVPHDVDLDEYGDDLVAKATLGEINSMHEYIGALEWQRDRQRKLLDEYERRDTAESIVRDIHLGKVTDSEAVERIRALP